MKKLLIINIILFLITIIAFFICPQRVESSKFLTTKVEIEGLLTALELFALDYKRYPSAMEGLEALLNAPNHETTGRDSYIDFLRKDSWGKPYNYLAPDDNYYKPRIYSNGPNGIDEKGEFDDIVSWEKEYTCE